MAQSLDFTVAHATLTVIDSVNGCSWKFTGACSIRLKPLYVGTGTKTAQYVISCGTDILKFNQQDIHLIAGGAPNGTPATDYASISALLPLYA